MSEQHDEQQQQQEPTSLAELYAAKGWDVRTSSGSRQDREMFARDVFDALSNGSSSVVVVAASVTDDDMSDVLAITDDDESILVLRNTDEYAKGDKRGQSIDGATIRARLNKYVSDNNKDENKENIAEPVFTDYRFNGDSFDMFTVK